MPAKSNVRRSASTRHVAGSSSASANLCARVSGPRYTKTPDMSGVFGFITQVCHGIQASPASLLHNLSVEDLFSGTIMATEAAPRIRAGIVGGTGYTGVELLRLLSQHPN